MIERRTRPAVTPRQGQNVRERRDFARDAVERERAEREGREARPADARDKPSDHRRSQLRATLTSSLRRRAVKVSLARTSADGEPDEEAGP